MRSMDVHSVSYLRSTAEKTSKQTVIAFARKFGSHPLQERRSACGPVIRIVLAMSAFSKPSFPLMVTTCRTCILPDCAAVRVVVEQEDWVSKPTFDVQTPRKRKWYRQNDFFKIQGLIV